MIRQELERGLTAAGQIVTGHQLEDLVRFAEELKKWNNKVNLTAITADRDMAIKHLVDALFVAPLAEEGQRVLDIGSGAGIPAIPLKIVKPGLRVLSVDAVAKKIHFQRHAARLLKLQEFEALHSRVEALHDLRAGQFGLILSRAFSDLTTFVRLAAPLLGEGGRVLAMKGPAAQREVDDEQSSLQSAGFTVSQVLGYELPFGYGSRSLVMLKRITPLS